ncbi:unnamed protein product [Lepeophtheirus salmonis]|uniref:(salmon louse) hypothetical protein n=1 Tax=Lepeophtheirus salmonis TaxID=72036 RepID=A0A7R8D2L2_LEPSM|nr:unnamed protein product [Lepeophtheirus salmonis]CAF3006279.1 unnamed protein product [Lepeophtheirus salmonis]
MSRNKCISAIFLFKSSKWISGKVIISSLKGISLIWKPSDFMAFKRLKFQTFTRYNGSVTNIMILVITKQEFDIAFLEWFHLESSSQRFDASVYFWKIKRNNGAILSNSQV